MDNITAIKELRRRTGMGLHAAAQALGDRVLNHNENWEEALNSLAPTLGEQLEEARAEIVFLRGWLRRGLTITDADIDAALKARNAR